jgi:hypothetical protein
VVEVEEVRSRQFGLYFGGEAMIIVMRGGSKEKTEIMEIFTLLP